MSKNIDLIAVALLLCGIAIYSHAKAVARFTVVSPVRIVMPSRFGNRVIIVPRAPVAPVPPVPFYRD